MPLEKVHPTRISKRVKLINSVVLGHVSVSWARADSLPSLPRRQAGCRGVRHPRANFDGGLVRLKTIDTRVTACFDGDGQPRKTPHQTRELVRQRVFRLAGYADCT